MIPMSHWVEAEAEGHFSMADEARLALKRRKLVLMTK
jgi:hypothetical protein